MTVAFRASAHSQNKSATDRHNDQTMPVHGSTQVDDDLAIVSHPLGIRPLGNGYLSTRKLRTSMGGFAMLQDEMIVQILEILEQPDLIALGSTCKALHAFSRLDDLWKTLWNIVSPEVLKSQSLGPTVRLAAAAAKHFYRSSKPISSWQGSWYATCRNLRKEYASYVDCTNLYSDVIHRPFVCAHTPLKPYCGNIPDHNAITKLSDLTTADFSERWTDEPFILTAPVKEWPVFTEWSSSSMVQKYGDTAFRAEAVDWPLRTYSEYMSDNQDESPLYLFDRSFVEKTGIQVGEKAERSAYWPPNCFGEDLFSVLSDRQPDRRWLIIGPERSGSTFHKDPNATSAWNAVIRGSKYWIMFPSRPGMPPPPGVFVSEDQSEVTSPLSIAEWLLTFHAEARKTPGCREAVCGEGEVLHVPSGWWHLVVNLSPSIAITQNFVPEKHLPNVLDFLKNKPDQVSGFPDDIEDAYGLFVEEMTKKQPKALEKALKEMESSQSIKKRKWESLVSENSRNGSGEEPSAFSFGFQDDSDEDVP